MQLFEFEAGSSDFCEGLSGFQWWGGGGGTTASRQVEKWHET